MRNDKVALGHAPKFSIMILLESLTDPAQTFTNSNIGWLLITLVGAISILFGALMQQIKNSDKRSDKLVTSHNERMGEAMDKIVEVIKENARQDAESISAMQNLGMAVKENTERQSLNYQSLASDINKLATEIRAMNR